MKISITAQFKNVKTLDNTMNYICRNHLSPSLYRVSLPENMTEFHYYYTPGLIIIDQPIYCNKKQEHFRKSDL